MKQQHQELTALLWVDLLFIISCKLLQGQGDSYRKTMLLGGSLPTKKYETTRRRTALPYSCTLLKVDIVLRGRGMKQQLTAVLCEYLLCNCLVYYLVHHLMVDTCMLIQFILPTKQ